MEQMIDGKLEIVVSVEQMRMLDAATIAGGVSGETLMGRAAQGVFEQIDWHGKVAIIAGGGNNGGDGYALACIMKEHDFAPVIFRTSEKLSDTAAYYEKRARALEVPIERYIPGCLAGYHILVDCMLGTGFTGSVRGIAKDAIQEINGSNAYVVSVDINSGLDGDTGEADLAVKSDLTVSIGFYKQGLLTKAAKQYIHALVNIDIGILPPA